MEQKFANIQTAYYFLSAPVLMRHSKWGANKKEHGKGIIIIAVFVLKVLNNERKLFNPSWNHWLHCKTDCVSVQRIKIVDSSEITVAKFLIYLFIKVDLLLYCRYMDLKKGIMLKKIRNPSELLKLQQNIKIFHKFT